MTKGKSVAINDVSKVYLLYRRPQDRFKQLLLRRFGKQYAQEFWALKGITFEVQPGETLGIIGRNGSGKSTLLQVIAGILRPTTGSVTISGRITALLELGAGFNPEFTGRENVYLNGAILGISRKEINDRLDEILDFADIGDYVDQPVKMYSSGMFVRLAFSISATLKPDILIVDEALAVGDAGFIIKCMKRIQELKERGTTILIVTHDIQTVRTLCDRAVWLNNGQAIRIGSTREVTSEYVQFLFKDSSSPKLATSGSTEGSYDDSFEEKVYLLSEDAKLSRWGSGELFISSCCINSTNSGIENVIFEYGQPMKIEVEIIARNDILSAFIGFGFGFRNTKGLDIITSTTYDRGISIPPIKAGQKYIATFQLENILAPGDYSLVLSVEDRAGGVPKYYDYIENAVTFKTVSGFHIFSPVLPRVIQDVRLIS